MLTVVALGGNALLRRDQDMDVETQLRNARVAAQAIARIAQKSNVVVTHGNGPQVGMLADQAQQTDGTPRMDVTGAESEGLIGHLLALSLRNVMPDRDIATLLTQTLVSDDDPAFDNPTKFIGRSYDETRAEQLAQRYGWHFRRDGKRLRRVVASPEPIAVLEQAAVATLLRAGTMVVAAGGGGVPVVRGADGQYRGCEGVVDKDKVSAALADSLDADRLLLLTDVDGVYLDWNSDQRRALRNVTPSQLAQHDFAAGSMGPKVAAACRFVRGRRSAAIGALEAAEQVWTGSAGTQVRADDD